MMRFNRSAKSVVNAFMKRNYKGTPQDTPLMQDDVSLIQDDGSFLQYDGSLLQDNGLGYRLFAKIQDKMNELDNDIKMGVRITPEIVNNLLDEFRSTKTHHYIRRINHYLENKSIVPNVETIEKMLKIHEESEDDVEASLLMTKLGKYNLQPTANMFNYTMRVLFEKKKWQTGSYMYSQMTASSIKPNEETFGLLMRYCTKTENEVDKYITQMGQEEVEPNIDTLADAMYAYVKVGSLAKAKQIPSDPNYTKRIKEVDVTEKLVTVLSSFDFIEEALTLYEKLKSSGHHPSPEATKKIIEKIKETDHEKFFEELLRDLTDYSDWDESCTHIISYYVRKEKISFLWKYVLLRVERWPEGNRIELEHFLDQALHQIVALSIKAVEFRWQVIDESEKMHLPLSRRILDCYLSTLYRRGLTKEFNLVFNQYPRFGFNHNIMNHLCGLKASVKSGDSQTAIAIKKIIQQAHGDAKFKTAYKKYVHPVTKKI